MNLLYTIKLNGKEKEKVNQPSANYTSQPPLYAIVYAAKPPLYTLGTEGDVLHSILPPLNL